MSENLIFYFEIIFNEWTNDNNLTNILTLLCSRVNKTSFFNFFLFSNTYNSLLPGNYPFSIGKIYKIKINKFYEFMNHSCEGEIVLRFHSRLSLNLSEYFRLLKEFIICITCISSVQFSWIEFISRFPNETVRWAFRFRRIWKFCVPPRTFEWTLCLLPKLNRKDDIA